MFKVAKQIQAGGQELQDRAEWFYHGPNLILVVADGAGGISGGAEAAEFVIQKIKQAIDAGALNVDDLEGLLLSIDQEMAAAKNFGETTCVIVALSNEKVFGASVGDSGAWVVSQKGIQNMTANQCRKPFIGSGCVTPVRFFRESWEGTLLIASDGLLKYASAEKIAAASITCDLDRAAQVLVDLVRYPSGSLPDDVSIVLARHE